MTTLFPLGIKVGLGLNEMGDPMVSLGMVLTEDSEPVEYVFSEPGIATALASIQEGLLRAIVIREMTTMFPDQKDQILATIHFRWTGTIDDGS